MFSRKLQLNGAVFYNDYKGYQATPNQCVDESGQILPLPFGTPGLCGQYLNVADAIVRGAELEVQAYPIERLAIDAAYSYLDFEFKTPKIQTTSVIAGRSAPGLGMNKWSLGVQYEIPIAWGGSLTPRADVVHTPGYCGDLSAHCSAQ